MTNPDFSARLGHYLEAFMVPFFFAQITVFAIGVIMDIDALFYLIFVTIVAYAMAAVIWWPKHGRGLCEACFAAFPLNAPEEATRIHRWLRLQHTTDDASRWILRVMRIPQNMLAQLGAFAALGAVVAALLVFVSPWLAVAAMLIAALMLRAALLHQRFSPWCPWCRRGPGDDEQTPTPDPDPVISQTL